jgi:hypothetical protein
MRRRAFLASAGIAALAGCSNGDGSTPTPTSTSTNTTTPTGTGSPNFELRGAEFPEATALNVPTAFAIGVQNTGSGAGTFSSDLETKQGDGEWTTVTTIEMELAAGETGEWHSPRFVPRYLGTYDYRLAAFDETWSIEITPKLLDFGNYYATPDGFYVNVLGGSFEREYPTPTNETATNGTATPTPTTAPEGQTWAIIRLDVRNRLEEPQTTPEASEFVLEVGGEQRSLHQEISDDPYERTELSGRTVTRGDLVYAVPEGTQAMDITVRWTHSYPDGDVEAVWTK